MNTRGTILILVAGLAAILLSVATAILVTLRSGSADAELVMRDAQARIMLAAGIAYIQEASRIGWGGESFGWTDIRHPIGAKFNGDTVPIDGVVGPLIAGATRLPVANRFPAPGTVARCDAFCWERPPAATSERFTPNPLEFRPDLPGRQGDDPAIMLKDKSWMLTSDNWIKDFCTPMGDYYRLLWYGNLGQIQNPGFGVKADFVGDPKGNNAAGKQGGLDVQPIADTYADFKSGSQAPRPETIGRGWFRVYRESPADHDGDGNPWYDTIPLRGHGVFIIAAGSGSTHGYRFWDRSSSDFLNGDRNRTAAWSYELEPETAAESGLFLNQEAFIAQRASERIIWYRLEWTGAVSGYDAWGEHAKANQDPAKVMSNEGSEDVRRTFLHRANNGNNPGYFPNFGGTIRWLMRLEREPDRW